MAGSTGRQGRRGDTTLRTLAEAAGVHVSTVSRALNPADSHKVSPETVARIRRLAAEHGFEPNPWAASLRTKRTKLIGLIIPRLVDGVLAMMFEAAASRARELGYDAMTFSAQDKPDEPERLVNVLLDRRVDGLILATAMEQDPTLEKLADAEVPFVLMNRASGEHPVVRADDIVGGQLATGHLLEQGHRRIAMVAGPDGVSTATLRRIGFRQAHADWGVEVDEALIVPSTFHADSGLDAGGRLLERAEPPTAVVAVNDATAIGVMAAARDQGLVVPDDVAVVGYNDSPIAAMLPIALSSVAIPLDDLGRLAVTLLIDRIQGESVESVVVPPVLRTRASSLRSSPG